MKDIKYKNINGKGYLGIELGTTRIKAVLIDEVHEQIASCNHTWENKLENGFWTYSLDDIWSGIQGCFAKLSEDVSKRYGMTLKTVGAIGISAMMHGYMAFDKEGQLLVPFRTWRNTNTKEAAEQLTNLFGFNIPLRWSIAHLYQAILNVEKHAAKIDFLTTLAGYIHWQLTGEKVLGIGDASGVFPINDDTRQYDSDMICKFEEIIKDKKYGWKVSDILPEIMLAGENAGVLTKKGAKMLDPSGKFKAGVPMCPPEGDAGTGMVATNSVRQRTGNVSAGTSVFAMAVLERPLSKLHPEVDMVTTPSGDPVAMVHCNNFLSDIDAWAKLLGEAAKSLGAEFNNDKLYATLYNIAMKGDLDCGGLLAYNYLSGESITGFDEGRPMFIRMPDAKFSLANFMRVHLSSACVPLKIGMDILFDEDVKLDSIIGHGGFFKVHGVGQRIMAAALGVPIKIISTAGEGGPWGMAILAAYMINSKGEKLDNYLSDYVFSDLEYNTIEPNNEDEEGFKQFVLRYKTGLKIERLTVESLDF